MQKFKIGDKVTVVDEEAMLAFSVPDYAPRTGIISEVFNDDKNGPAVRFEVDVWWYPAKCLAFDPPKAYSVREVLEAHREYNGYSSGVSDVTVKAVQKILDRRNDPDYATYLELKARFEN